MTQDQFIGLLTAALLGQSFAVLKWGITVQARLKTHDTLFEEREKQQDQRFRDVETRLLEGFDRTTKQLDRIDQKLDSVIADRRQTR